MTSFSGTVDNQTWESHIVLMVFVVVVFYVSSYSIMLFFLQNDSATFM